MYIYKINLININILIYFMFIYDDISRDIDMYNISYFKYTI